MHGQHKDALVPGKLNAGGERLTRGYRGTPDAAPSRAPAYVASPDFRRQTEAALRREEIPPAYRRRVRDYFESLQRP